MVTVRNHASSFDNIHATRKINATLKPKTVKTLPANSNSQVKKKEKFQIAGPGARNTPTSVF